ncbi:MAG: AAA family ATPase [Spirochaetaceae bacterium]|jgi:putative ATPase|nr:AAA family ATPase [Spirochaetaceae bacterium]
MDASDLFDSPRNADSSPLADRMRPQTLDEIIGQDHIVGPGRLLRRAIAADRLSSLIFYGPPGTGKTSLARVIANTTKAHFESLNAVLAGIKDIREAIDNARERFRLHSKRTILFVDEVHRWNKAQQDALLPWVENGTVILVGATTENPFFEVNRALVSRSRVFQLLPLDAAALTQTALHALANRERGYGKWNVIFAEGALPHLVEVASGDARSLLNALELAVETSPPHWQPPEGETIEVSLEAAEESIQRRAVLYDKDGDYHFDTISAFIKSVRGSDVDAALYWLARMVRAGEDPAFIFRRMIILASEDVGMADPKALAVVISCAESFDRIGFPEGNYPLAHACIYLASAPKSNSAMAFFDALAQVEKEDAEIPNHLRDANRDKESFGHGQGYVYPHAYREHWTAQQYLPSALQGKTFYIPSEIGYEKKIRDGVLKKREIQAAHLFAEDMEGKKLRTDEDFLTWGAASKGKEAWFKRLESGRSRLLLADRDRMMEAASPTRHSRILILHGGDGLLLWEAMRRVPEGLAACAVATEQERQNLLTFASNAVFKDDERALFCVPQDGEHIPSPEEAQRDFQCAAFDIILCREPWRKMPQELSAAAYFGRELERIKKLLSPEGVLVMLQSPPVQGERLSRILRAECAAGDALVGKLAEAEEAFFKGAEHPEGEHDAEPHAELHGGAPFRRERRFWDEEALLAAFAGAHWQTEIRRIAQREERLLLEKDIALWFGKSSRWGRFMSAALGEADYQQVRALLTERAGRGPLVWRWTSLLSVSRCVTTHDTNTHE